MNVIQRLERLKEMLASVRRLKLWVLISFVVCCGGFWVLSKAENTQTIWVKAILVVIIAALLFMLLWLSTFFFIGKINKKLKFYYTNGIPNTSKREEKTQFSFSRLLSLRQRIEAFKNFRELKEMSDYCFLGGPASYLRIQWNPKFLEEYDTKEVLKSWPEENEIWFPCKVGNDEKRLTVVRDCDEERERVFACLTSKSPTEEECREAEKVELTLNEPCILAYGWVYDETDGSKNTYNENYCIITWIGGNR